jgi:hypothetical protein
MRPRRSATAFPHSSSVVTSSISRRSSATSADLARGAARLRVIHVGFQVASGIIDRNVGQAVEPFSRDWFRRRRRIGLSPTGVRQTETRRIVSSWQYVAVAVHVVCALRPIIWRRGSPTCAGRSTRLAPRQSAWASTKSMPWFALFGHEVDGRFHRLRVDSLRVPPILSRYVH